MSRRLGRAGAMLLAGALLASACGGDDGDLGGPEGPLTGVCPDPVVVQTDWYPQVEHAALYRLIVDGDRRVDAGDATVAGRLVAEGVDQGVVLELRSGGIPAAHVDVARVLHEDPGVLLGVTTTDEQIQLADRFPTTGLLALLERDPLMIMWDPGTYDVDRLVDLPPETTVSLFGPGLIADHLVAAGVFEPGQLTFDRPPGTDHFVATGGAVAQVGFATSDPLVYEHEAEGWRRPVRYQLLEATGWYAYAGVLVATPTAGDDHAECLSKLVPLIQRAMVAVDDDPDATVRLITDLLGRYDARWRYTGGQAAWAADQLRAVGLVADSPDGVAGGFDHERVQRALDQVVALLGRGDELAVDGLVTDRFLDPAVSLGR